MHKAPVTKLNRMTNRALPQMLVNVAGRLMDSATFFAMAAVRPSKSMIFMFHGIESAKDSYQYDNSTPLHSRSVFECFVAWLRQAARIVPLEDILCEPQSDDGVARAALTFDDGLLNHYTAVYPLLRELDARATFFVPSGLIGTPGQMTRAMIRELSAGGMSIGSHTVTHPALPALSLREAHAELYESKAALEDLTGKPCADLAYPYGLYDAISIALAESIGYRSAAAASMYPSPGSRFAVRRASIPETTSHWNYRLALMDAQAWRRPLRKFCWLEALIHARVGYNADRAQARFQLHANREEAPMACNWNGSLGETSSLNATRDE